MTGSLGFQLDWIEVVDGEPVFTMANFAVLVDGEVVWPVRGDAEARLDCYAEDVLSYLAECWQPLLLRQSLPLPVEVVRPSDLEREAWRRWNGRRSGEIAAESQAVIAFRDAHNMSLSFSGQFDLPPLWFLRQGDKMLVDTGTGLDETTLDSFVSAASDLGDRILDRLEKLDASRWSALAASWRGRDAGDPVNLQALAAELDLDLSRELIAEDLLEPVTSVQEAANDNSELRMAARMMGALPAAHIRRVLLAARAVELTDSPQLESMSAAVRGALDRMTGRDVPYEQGTLAARVTRALLDSPLTDPIDPFAVLSRLGVPLSTPRLGLATLDAVSIWGPRHGPGVILNADSRRFSGKGRARFKSLPETRITAAHELCHLLVDRDRALGAVDILNGRMPVAVEQRARAYAAELMLPAETAVGLWRASRYRATASGLEAFMNELKATFTVTGIVARNQLEHGLNGSDPRLVFLLDQVIPRR